jgi:hypothetical protein
MEVELSGYVIDEGLLEPVDGDLDDPELVAVIDEHTSRGIPEHGPTTGWRIVQWASDTSMVVAAPDGGSWAVIELVRRARRWEVLRFSWAQRVRETPRQLGQGFRLEWPVDEFVVRVGKPPDIKVRLVNDSRTRRDWLGSPWAHGHLVDLETGVALPSESVMNFAAIGWQYVVKPGRFVDIHVSLWTRNLEKLPEGVYGVTASFHEFALVAPPGRLRVSRTGR